VPRLDARQTRRPTPPLHDGPLPFGGRICTRTDPDAITRITKKVSYKEGLVMEHQVEPAEAGRSEIAVSKRSVFLHGHRTSVSLEQAFWDELNRLARDRGQSTNALVAEIDRHRAAGGREEAGNLSSAVRLFVLAELQRAADATSANDEN
jgi:predicted DNA-binding ribbon-helix-helix protein